MAAGYILSQKPGAKMEIAEIAFSYMVLSESVIWKDKRIYAMENG
jgi:hypothetical protein